MQITYTPEALFPVLSNLLRVIDFLDESYLRKPQDDLILDDGGDDSLVGAGDATSIIDESDIPAYAFFDEARFDYEERLLRESIGQFEVLIFPILRDKAMRDAFETHCTLLRVDVAYYMKKNRKTVLSLAPTPK